jgi:hypothetical protein
MAYNLITAAVATGVHRTTLLRAIKAGKISAERDEQGAWVIQPSELHRVFAPLPQLPAAAEPVHAHHPEMEIALLRTMLDEMRATVADLRRREDVGVRRTVQRSGYYLPQSSRTLRKRTGPSGRGNGRGGGSAQLSEPCGLSSRA